MGAQIGVIRVEDALTRALQQAPFDGAIGVEGAMALQVIRGEGRPDPHLGGHPWGGFDLVAAELHHQPVGLGEVGLDSFQHQLSR